MPRTLLLIGAGGFAGAHLAAAAATAGVRVVAAGREATAEAPACDLLDPASVRACVATVRPERVVNAAGAASVASSWERPGEAFAVNAAGVLSLLEAVAREAPRAHVLCVSSAEVYGESAAEELPLAEAREPRPITPYGASKAAMEVICGQYARGRGLRIAIARAFNLLGPGQAERFAVSGFARRIAAAERDDAGEVDLALGNPAASRDFTDVRDAARALLEISSRQLRGTYNLCSGRGVTIAELVAELSRSARLPVRAHHDLALARPADPAALLGDPGKLRQATGYDPAIPLTQTLGDLLEWWRARLAST